MINYPPDLAQYVDQTIANGMFQSRDEFAVEAARVYRELEARHRQLKSEVQAAIDAAESGDIAELDIKAIQRELIAELDDTAQPKSK